MTPLFPAPRSSPRARLARVAADLRDTRESLTDASPDMCRALAFRLTGSWGVVRELDDSETLLTSALWDLTQAVFSLAEARESGFEWTDWEARVVRLERECEGWFRALVGRMEEGTR